MNIEEINYSDFLFNLANPILTAQSWDNIVQASPSNQEESDYHNYWSPLSPQDKEDSEYAIFSDLYERLDPQVHEAYNVEFTQVGYALDGFCQRKKKPAK